MDETGPLGDLILFMMEPLVSAEYLHVLCLTYYTGMYLADSLIWRDPQG